MLLAAEAVDLWRFQPHPEVWLLLVSLTGLYIWAIRVVGPKAVPEGEPVVTRRQIAAGATGLVALWIASDWPMHDIGEQYLYSVHMVQHTLLTLVIPPLALLATPRWLADLILGSGRVRRFIQIAAKPVVAGVAFNAMTMAIHWPALVNASVSNGALHYVVHIAIVFTAFMMWTPVCGPIQEWRMGPPAQMVYLFFMSIIPTVPGGWLTFADGAVYTTYDYLPRPYDISLQSDQQAAGVFMKLGAGGLLWVIITVKFFIFALGHQRAEEDLARASRLPADPDPDDERDDTLTFDEVSRAFAESDAAAEPHSPRPR